MGGQQGCLAVGAGGRPEGGLQQAAIFLGIKNSMDLKYSQEEEAFRAQVRAFLDKELPPDISEKSRLGKRLAKNDFIRWQKILNARGWGAVMWPKKFGGAGWNIVQQHIFEEERVEAGAPAQIAFAFKMVSP